MAGARIEIEVDDAAVRDVLQQAQASLSPDGLQTLLGELGEYLKNATQDRAAHEVDPSGTQWSALSPRYLLRKQKQRPGVPMLKFDNHMLGDRLAWQVVDGVLYVGTSAPYGARQQFGGGGIPARAWLGVNDDDVDEIHARTLDYLHAALDGHA